MRKLIVFAAAASLLAAGALFADVPLNNAHKGLKKDGESVNCAYCHTKAAIPKKGKDYAPFKSNASCKGQGCH